MTSRCRFTSGQSRGRGAGGQPPAQAAPPVEAYGDRNEELLGRLLCVTARDDAFSERPSGTLRSVAQRAAACRNSLSRNLPAILPDLQKTHRLLTGVAP
jgi:hypothetical protein